MEEKTMKKTAEHYIKGAKREMGQDIVIFHKFIELENGTFLREYWNKGNVFYYEYNQDAVDKMNQGEFNGVL